MQGTNGRAAVDLKKNREREIREQKAQETAEISAGRAEGTPW